MSQSETLQDGADDSGLLLENSHSRALYQALMSSRSRHLMPSFRASTLRVAFGGSFQSEVASSGIITHKFVASEPSGYSARLLMENPNVRLTMSFTT